LSGAIEQRERSLRRGEMLPDELKHQELVEVDIEQRPGNRVELPIVIVRAPGQVNNHCASNVPEAALNQEVLSN
jgi:hypothetical protein